LFIAILSYTYVYTHTEDKHSRNLHLFNHYTIGQSDASLSSRHGRHAAWTAWCTIVCAAISSLRGRHAQPCGHELGMPAIWHVAGGAEHATLALAYTVHDFVSELEQ